MPSIAFKSENDPIFPNEKANNESTPTLAGKNNFLHENNKNAERVNGHGTLALPEGGEHRGNSKRANFTEKGPWPSLRNTSMRANGREESSMAEGH
jgi:hypothetical protein